MSQERGLDGSLHGPGPASATPWSAPDAGAERGPIPAFGGMPPVAVASPEPAYRARPGGIPLRPLGVGDLLDGTFSTIRRNPRATVGLAAVLVTLQQALAVGVQLATGGVPTLTGFASETFSFQAIGGFGDIVGTLLAAVVGAVLTGMLVVVVSEDVLGRTVSAGEVWRRVRPRLWALLVAAAVAGILPYLGLVFLVVPGVILWGAWSLTTPALVLEGLGPFAALRRSWRLVWPGFMRVWSVRSLSESLAALMHYLIAVPFALAGTLAALAIGADEGDQLPVIALVLIVLGDIAAGMITAPFLAGVLALLYVDRRMRAEGLDLVLRRHERTVGASRGMAAVPPAAPGGGP